MKNDLYLVPAALISLLLLTLAGCSSAGVTCMYNNDCPPGYVCVSSWCRNMYYPKIEPGTP